VAVVSRFGCDSHTACPQLNCRAELTEIPGEIFTPTAASPPAANRSERNLELTLAAIAEQEKHREDVEAKLSEELASNTVLT
jgi:hypothetical protein